MDILTGIRGPEDVKRLSLNDAYRLAGELRQYIVATVAVNGGHLASNLGTVELTLALHRVFSTPRDSIVWDVGHQSYTHKIITGRKDAFATLRRSGGLSGFPKRAESVHDAFDAGHASTSLSAALGLLIANRALGKSDAVIAVIGDGALTGGMAYEALSHAGQLGLPLIVILNDNSMSISPNVGAVSSYLSRLTTTVSYQNFRRLADKAMLMIPLAGELIHDSVQRAKNRLKPSSSRKVSLPTLVSSTPAL
jgi:1-deoxy-D-xylulose-5-phosphate synthase